MLNDSQSDSIDPAPTVPIDAAATSSILTDEAMTSVQNNIRNEVGAVHEYKKYREMLPYNTDDPELHRRQETVLDFLIVNGICTDKNFKIFIAEPDSHRAEADRILDQLYVIEETDFAASVSDESNNATTSITDDVSMSPASQISTMTLGLALGSPTANIRRANAKIASMVVAGDNNWSDPSSSSSSTTKKPETKNLFPIFTDDAECRKERKIVLELAVEGANNCALQKWKSVGRNQLQIDAGQNAFGGKTCNSCGMFYSVHEPEEELLHLKFHKARNMLGFKVDLEIFCNNFINKLYHRVGKRNTLFAMYPNGVVVDELFSNAYRLRRNLVKIV